MKTNMNKKLEVRSEKLETNGSAALPYSSNSYLLTPQCSANSYLLTPQCSAKSVKEVYPARAGMDSPVVRRPLFVARCSLFVERQRRRAAFSLAEILIAIFVLSIGLIMIAAVFPVAAKWTAEDAQTSVAQVIAKNAVAQIEAQYAGSPANIPATVLGGTNGYGPFVYSFGNAQPFQFGTHQAVTATNYAPFPLDPAPAAPTPAPVPPPGSYYWSALMLPAASTYAGSSGVYPGAQNKGIYTLYIFVFNKGDTNNVFPTPPPPLHRFRPGPDGRPSGRLPRVLLPSDLRGVHGQHCHGIAHRAAHANWVTRRRRYNWPGIS